MYWYDFPKNEIYVGEGGEYKRKHLRAVTSAEREKIEKLFADHILKIYYTDESSYDNSDDERASDSYYKNSSYVYRSVNTERDLYSIAIRDGEVVGVVFYVNTSRETYATVFNFDGNPRTSVTLGYSASHSSSYTTICRVELVARSAEGVPEKPQEASFIQHKMYPNL